MARSRATRVAHRRQAAAALVERLQAGDDVVFLTEGDPLLYSTFNYLLNDLPSDIAVEIVPGVSSVTAAAAALGGALVNEGQRMAILPATFEEAGRLRAALGEFDTVVLLKVSRVLGPLIDLLESLDLLDSAALVECASHRDERVVHDLRTLRGASVHYLSLVIVHGKPRDDDR